MRHHPPLLRRPGDGRSTPVVVRPGDSLWSIAEADLPPGAPDRAVVSRWHAIYAVNRALVGPDPDLLEPGQRLHL
ncbi:LysM domain-containing protein [Nocardioides sp.]|uniref:LysM peptidoglycan-binding domain-containing protein n=1 Tax=Nocardioides sp. TaxID=35761 RepID=UPI002F40DD91